MDALLDTGRGNHVCNSVQDMQTRLQNLLASKSSDTRAEHASFTFELRYNTVFHLGADAENGSPEGGAAQTITRSVNASETIQNQPGDDPVLQRAVAKHIVNAMGIIDSSSWVVRQVSRDARGWTFTYICKDSLQAWTRTNAKLPEKPAIASYSGPGGLDPINLSRPAFDCRGMLTIAFSTSARAVVVKYNHTPIHKSVAQLVQLLGPPLPPPAAQNNNANNQRTARAKRPPPADGEEGGRRKRQKKTGKAPEAPMGELPAGESSSTAGQNSQGNVAPQPTVSDGLHLTSILNVPPAEAERRRQTAINLLNGKGINPATLTAEQFNIFANQAPDLQTASLDMLARYGAERLRIVHPDEKEQAQSANSTPAEKQPASATPSTAPATMSTPDTTETPTKKRRSRKKKSDGPAAAEVSIGDGAVVSIEQSGEVGTTASALKPKGKKTRGACQVCKERKIKCTKEHPSCSNCRDAGIGCIYLPPKPRRKRSSVNGEVEEQEDSDLPGETQENQMQAQAQAPAEASTSQMPVQHAAPAAFPSPPDPDNEEFIPDPNILSGPIEHQSAITRPLAQPQAQHSMESSGYFHRIKFPKNSRESGKHMEMPELTFPESHSQGAHSESSPNLTYSSITHQSNFGADMAFPQQTPTTDQKKENYSAASRRSLPSGQSKQTPIPAPTIPQNTSDWNPSPTPGHAITASPTLTKKQTPKRSRSRKSVTETSQPGQVQEQEHDGMKQAAALSQAAIQQQGRPSPAVESPYQTAPRLKSRQSNRSQTSTPVTSTSRPLPQASQVATNASYNATPAASIPNYDPYPRYDNSTGSQYANVANDQGSSRIAYEPGSYHQPTTGATTTSTSYSTAPAYDYSQGNRSSNPLSQALNTSTGYTNTNTNTSTTAQWAPPRTQSTQPHTQSHTTNSYSMPATTTTASHGYGTRSSGSRAPRQNTSYNQPQSHQPYGSYPAQQPSTSQQAQQEWYRFASQNNSNTSTGQNSYNRNQTSGFSNATNSARAASYNNQRSNVPNYETQDFGARSDDQSLYDLLRASGSTH